MNVKTIRRPAISKARRFESIPYPARKQISRQALGSIVGKMLGGSYKKEKHPWESRRSVRDIMKETGHYEKLKQRTKFKQDEAVSILKDFREVMRKRRAEQGFGLSEKGEYYGVKEKDVYRKFVEEVYNKERGPSSDEARQAALEERVLKARRREFQRKELGLAPMTVRKLTEERGPRASERRADLEVRLEASRNKSAPGKPAAPQPQATSGVPPPTGIPAPSAGNAPFAAHLHLPPRHASDRPTSEVAPAFPQPTKEPQDDEDQDLIDSDAPQLAPPEPEEPPPDIDENLPL